MRVMIIIEDVVYEYDGTANPEFEVASLPFLPMDLPDFDLEDFKRPKQVFAHPENEKTPVVRLPVPAMNRRLTQFMRMHNR